MTITVAHLTIDLSCDCKAPLLGNEREVHINRIQITYWGIYLDDKHISYTLS